ncbi:hypothetical protein QK289_15570, partial [Exiguobacterium antarcticum]
NGKNSPFRASCPKGTKKIGVKKMKLQELKEISKAKGRSKKEQLQAILQISQMAMIHSTVYGEFKIIEQDDHLEFHFKSEHYGEVHANFKSRNELERIKDNLKMAYYEAEDITRELRETEIVTEALISKSSSFYQAINQAGRDSLSEVSKRVMNFERKEYNELKPLLNIYASVNKKVLEVTFTEVRESTKNNPFIEKHYLPFNQYIKLA